MTKALLIRPAPNHLVETNTKKFHRRFPPLSLLYIASMLRNDDWQVTLFDMHADPIINKEEVLSKAKEFNLIIVTTNPYADWQCPSYDIDPIIKFCQQLPSERLILIGNHGTHFPGDLLKQTGAKIVVRGEPEIIVSSIAKAIKGNDLNLKHVEGISFKNASTIIHNAMPKPSNEFDFPKPAYDLVNLQNYQYELLGGNFAILETTRGCPYTCSFCNLSMFVKRYRKRPAPHVLDEIDDLVENHGCRSLYIFDLEFAVNVKMAETVCQHLIKKDYVKKYKFKWTCQTRADSISAPLLKLMKLSGCELIHFGVESGNNDILSATNKRIDKNSIKKGILDTQQAGINIAAFFMFGFPGETQKTYQETLDFALKLNPTYASFHPLLPIPGSPLYTEKYGPSPYWDDKVPANMTYFDEKQALEINSFIKKAYKAYYIRPKYIWQTLSHGKLKLYKMQLNLFKNFAFNR